MCHTHVQGRPPIPVDASPQQPHKHAFDMVYCNRHFRTEPRPLVKNATCRCSPLIGDPKGAPSSDRPHQPALFHELHHSRGRYAPALLVGPHQEVKHVWGEVGRRARRARQADEGQDKITIVPFTAGRRRLLSAALAVLKNNDNAVWAGKMYALKCIDVDRSGF